VHQEHRLDGADDEGCVDGSGEPADDGPADDGPADDDDAGSGGGGGVVVSISTSMGEEEDGVSCPGEAVG
jgi:hypothetical protein